MIVQVTASRDWDDKQTVEAVLDFVWACCLAAAGGLGPETLTVRHGAARGGDTLAHLWAVRQRNDGLAVTPDPHPAQWNLYGQAAGRLRNTAMIELGNIDVCLAFSRSGSSGTADCAEKARAARIPVWWQIYGQPLNPPPPARLLGGVAWQ